MSSSSPEGLTLRLRLIDGKLLLNHVPVELPDSLPVAMVIRVRLSLKFLLHETLLPLTYNLTLSPTMPFSLYGNQA